jgi:hypothetical protein
MPTRASIAKPRQMTSARQPAVIHVDLDGATEIYQIHGWRYEGSSDSLFVSGLRHALRFFAENRIRATLFVIARQLDDPRKRELLEEAVRQGHEIASHTLTHRCLPQLSRREKHREIFTSRDRIHAALGVEPRGFRAPGFHMDHESLELVSEAGYTYDSSLFPAVRCARRAGVKRVCDFPHRPLASRDLMELSLPNAAPLPFPFHPCFSLVLGMRYFHIALRRFHSRGVPLVFLFHLTDFADPMPKALLKGCRDRFYTLSFLSHEHKRHRCQQMLDAVRERFEIVATKELADAMMAGTYSYE